MQSELDARQPEQRAVVRDRHLDTRRDRFEETFFDTPQRRTHGLSGSPSAMRMATPSLAFCRRILIASGLSLREEEARVRHEDDLSLGRT